jgi:predicted nucleic acid-binding protein
VIAFLDASVVIYFVEQPPVWGRRATARLAALQAAGDRVGLSDLVRMECQVKPLQLGDAARLRRFAAFFTDPDVQVLPVTAAVCDRAASIRAAHGFKPLDALHLAAEVENRCGLFLTGDARLARFPGIAVEVLT